MPDPLVVQVMRTFRKDLLQREAAQRVQMAQRWQSVERALQDEVNTFVERVAADGLTPGQLRSRQFQLDRYASLLAQARREMSRYMDVLAPQIAEQQRTLGAQGIRAATAAINAITGTRVGFDVLPIAAIENLVGLAGNGSPLRSLLDASYGAGADGMLQQLINGVALGANPKVIARNMVRNGLSQTLARVMVTARTEPLRVYRESSRQQYQASGVVTHFRRLATRDRRTCPACLFADGEVYELGDTLREHPQGRCLVAGTLVHTGRGLVPIERVRIGDTVLTHTGQYKRVTNTAQRYYNGDVVTLRRDGYSVTLTPEHRVYTGLDWIEARAATTFWTLNDVSRRVSSLRTVQPLAVNKLSFLRSLSKWRPLLCQPGSSSTANWASTNAKSMLNMPIAYSLTGASEAACIASSNSFSLSLEHLRQLACLVNAALRLDSGSLRFETNLLNDSGSLSFWRLPASLGEIGEMPKRRISRINDLVLMLASAVNSRYVAFSSTYRRRNQSLTDSPNCFDSASTHADDRIDTASCTDFVSPKALARCWTALKVRPSNMLAIPSALIESKLSLINLSSWVVHCFPAIGTIIHQPCVTTQKYTGMVYDLTVSDDHSFIAGGVVVHNCTTIPVVEGFKPVEWEKGIDWFKKQDPTTQRKMLGNGVFDAWKRGDIELEQTISVKHDPTWGDSLHPTPLRELLGAKKFFVKGLPEPKKPKAQKAPTINKQTATQARKEIGKLEKKNAKEIADINKQVAAVDKEASVLNKQGEKIFQELEKLDRKISPYNAKQLAGTLTDDELLTLRGLKQDRQRVTDEYDALDAQVRQILNQKIPLGQRVQLLNKQLRDDILRVVQVDDPSEITIRFNSSAAPDIAARVNKAKDEFNKLFSKDILWDRYKIDIEFLKSNERAFASPAQAEISITRDQEERVIIHEMAHVLEVRGGLLDKVLAFYDRRTAGDKLKKMSDITGNKAYRANEVARRDKFLSAYMGKDYGRSNTEIVSMGLEYMYAEPARLAKEDPDYFDFIYELVRGR